MRPLRNKGREDYALATEGEETLFPLFARNRAWAHAKTHEDPGFFQRLVGQQRPRYFWIGCSDSRVPATEIVDLDPGEMFVHRNVANLATADDPNFSAALQFAVDVLKVKHIIVVGHYGCGGIQAAMTAETHDAIGAWLAPVRALHQSHDDADHLCERNVLSQVEALASNPLIRRAWKRKAAPRLHGWVYAIGDGLLQPVCESVAGPAAGTYAARARATVR
jgi:carbonic anhydrase